VIVAIDGPAGAGKSTVARALAARIGATYLDTGAMYRALTALAIRRGIAPGAGEELAALAAAHPVELRPLADGVHVRIAGIDVTEEIRRDQVTDAVSEVSAHGGVRRAMVDAQRAILHGGGDWVADGRDIGTVVAPDAALKVFLTAGVEERARRRAAEMRGRGEDVHEDDVAAAVRRRDELDSSRAEAPLRAAEDAVRVDTTGIGVEEVTARIAALVERVRADGRPVGA
jgi:cytidylate kinase